MHTRLKLFVPIRKSKSIKTIWESRMPLAVRSDIGTHHRPNVAVPRTSRKPLRACGGPTIRVAVLGYPDWPGGGNAPATGRSATASVSGMREIPLPGYRPACDAVSELGSEWRGNPCGIGTSAAASQPNSRGPNTCEGHCRFPPRRSSACRGCSWHK